MATQHILYFHTKKKNKKFHNIYKMPVYSEAKLYAIIIYYYKWMKGISVITIKHKHTHKKDSFYYK